MFKSSRDWLLAFAVVGACVIYTLPASVQAQAPGSPLNMSPLIFGCVHTGSGQLRLVNPGQACNRAESPVMWNVVGPQGPKGNVGPQGPQGNIGPPGPMGLRGFTGNIGPAGPKGDIGPVGPPGKQGFPGNIGPAGPQGEIGPVGPPGKQGFPGNTGPAGPTGPQGPPGDPGTAFVGGRAIGLVVESCNMTPYVGFVSIPGSSHVSWTDAHGSFDFFQIIPGNYSLAFPYVSAPPDKAVRFEVQEGKTTLLGAILVGQCQAANDPCVNGTNVCDTDATCRLTGPSTYSCTCNTGFAGDGKTCNPINACLSNPCDPNAACSTTGPGTFACTCKAGYTGNGLTCDPIDACLSKPCDLDEVCTATGPGTFVCTPKPVNGSASGPAPPLLPVTKH